MKQILTSPPLISRETKSVLVCVLLQPGYLLDLKVVVHRTVSELSRDDKVLVLHNTIMDFTRYTN